MLVVVVAASLVVAARVLVVLAVAVLAVLCLVLAWRVLRTQVAVVVALRIMLEPAVPVGMVVQES
jgi:hypothetical protein